MKIILRSGAPEISRIIIAAVCGIIITAGLLCYRACLCRVILKGHTFFFVPGYRHFPNGSSGLLRYRRVVCPGIMILCYSAVVRKILLCSFRAVVLLGPVKYGPLLILSYCLLWSVKNGPLLGLPYRLLRAIKTCGV